MTDGMQRVHVSKKTRVVHVETELGIVNIWVGLNDRFGRRVNTIEIIGNRCRGDLIVKVLGNRLIELKKKG